MRSGGTLLRRTRAARATPAKSSGRTSLSTPRCFPIGVRTASTMRASGICFLLRGEHYLSKLRAVLEEPMRFRGLLQRQHPVQHGAEPALLHELKDAEQIALGAHRAPQKRDALVEEDAKVELGLVPGGCAARHQPAAVRQAGDTLFEGGLADVLEDDVDHP